MAIGIAIIKEIELDHVTIVAAEFEERGKVRGWLC
jgi:hypothetical protein